jgi:hypothetical protein
MMIEWHALKERVSDPSFDPDKNTRLSRRWKKVNNQIATATRATKGWNGQFSRPAPQGSMDPHNATPGYYSTIQNIWDKGQELGYVWNPFVNLWLTPEENKVAADVVQEMYHLTLQNLDTRFKLDVSGQERSAIKRALKRARTP